MNIVSALISVAAILLSNNSFAQIDIAAGKIKTATCAACHATDGNSALPTNPKLAGQHAAYLVKQMQDFQCQANKEKAEALKDLEERKRTLKQLKCQNRTDPTMSAMVKDLSAQDIENIAGYYASQKNVNGSANADDVKLGQKIFEGGNPRTKVPACMGCHSPTGSGNGPAKFPNLAGQHVAYTIKQLKDFREAARVSVRASSRKIELPKIVPGRTNDKDRMMQVVVQDMSDDEIEAVASYIHGLRIAE